MGTWLEAILETDDPAATIRSLLDGSPFSLPLANITLLPPIDRQEVWAAGVTYKRSKTARMEESEGAARFYDLVFSFGTLVESNSGEVRRPSRANDVCLRG